MRTIVMRSLEEGGGVGGVLNSFPEKREFEPPSPPPPVSRKVKRRSVKITVRSRLMAQFVSSPTSSSFPFHAK